MAGAANDVTLAGRVRGRAIVCRAGHRRVLAAVALPMVVLAGCGRAGDDLPDPTPPVGTGGPPVSPVDASPDYPATAEDYAQQAVAAWAAPDLIRLAELTTSDVHGRVMALPGPPDPHWTFVGCAGGRDSSDCGFYNAAGDALVVTVDHALLGGPRAAVAAEYGVTSYPDELVPYLAEFVAAWRSGNLARMDNLAVAAVVEVFAELPAPTAAEYTVGGTSAGLAHVRVTVSGQQISTRVSTALLGEQHAIRSATLRPVT